MPASEQHTYKEAAHYSLLVCLLLTSRHGGKVGRVQGVK